MSQNNQTLVIGLVVVAVLLAAVAGVVIWQQTQAVPAASPTASTLPAGQPAQSGTPSTGGTTGGAAAQSAPAPSEVDAKTATKVPKGTEPKDFVKTYYEACDKGDWKAAFDALPADKKTGNSPDALQQQVSGYGIKGWELTAAETKGDTATVKVDQVTESYGTFENTWTFAKKDGVWLVTSKAVTGMK